jgi:hypothetical protein
MTHIFTTKKLEKIIHKKIENSDLIDEHILGNWNANVFYVAKKKCLLFVNSQTFFSVVIPRFSMKDIDKLDALFLDSFYTQLLFEKITVDYKNILDKIGEVTFHSTNNNRKTIGVLTYNIEKLNYFKYDYPVFNASVIREMTQKLNRTPFKQLGWKTPNEKMISLLAKNK